MLLMLRTGGVVTSAVAVTLLLTMWSTQWGDRNRIGKSLLLSILIHLAIGFSWGAIVEARATMEPVVTAAVATENVTLKLVDDQSLDTPASLDQSRSTSPTVERAHSAFDRRQLAAEIETAAIPVKPTPVAFDGPAVSLPGEIPLDRPAPEPTLIDEPRNSRSAPRPATSIAIDDERATIQTPARRPGRFGRTPQPSTPAETPAESPIATSAEPAPVARTESPLVPPLRQITPSPRPAIPIARAAGPERRPSVAAPRELAKSDVLIRGVVTDQSTGRPLARTSIRFDRQNREPLIVVTQDNGTYEMLLSEVPDAFAVAVARDDYLPDARHFKARDVKGRVHRVDFSLRPDVAAVIAVENDPGVHHLGNNQFEGEANSKFQRKSEGAEFAQMFTIPREKLPREAAPAEIRFLAKGVQCPPQLTINGHPIATAGGVTPEDGTYGTLTFPFNTAHLKAGANEFRLKASTCQGDLDDFEFVNVQIHFSGLTIPAK